MEMDEIEDASQMEINISNTNAQSQIVLNDLRLLELLYLYPFLFSKRIRPQQDLDYDDWAWEQITTAFNMSYADLTLSAPFSAEELQWRWDILRPLMGTLSKAKGQIPDILWSTIVNMYKMMDQSQSPRWKPLSSLQNFILDQTSLVEQLSPAQRKRLEVEVLDAIFQKELRVFATLPVGKKEMGHVRREYDEFLKAIRVKELPSNSQVSNGSATKPASSSSSDEIIKRCETNLVISKVFSAQEQLQLSLLKDSGDGKAASTSEPQLYIKSEPPNDYEIETQPAEIPKNDKDMKLRYIPLKCAKYYIKNVRVRLKRIDVDDYIPLANIRKLSTSSRVSERTVESLNRL